MDILDESVNALNTGTRKLHDTVNGKLILHFNIKVKMKPC